MIWQNLRKNLCKNRLNIVEIFQKRTEHGPVPIQFVNLTVMETYEKILFWFAKRPAGGLKVKFNIRGIKFIWLRNSFKNRKGIKTFNCRNLGPDGSLSPDLYCQNDADKHGGFYETVKNDELTDYILRKQIYDQKSRMFRLTIQTLKVCIKKQLTLFTGHPKTIFVSMKLTIAQHQPLVT